jgi:hypothetical protein
MKPGGRLVHADVAGRRGRVPAARFARRCRSAGDLEVGFWASQQLVRDRAALLIIWVGLLALFRGITEIVLAFELKSAQHR